MSFTILAVLVGLFVFLNHVDDRNPEPDPGYGTEHNGAYFILGFIGLAIVGVLIYILFTDLLGFLAAASGVLIVSLFSPSFREQVAKVRDQIALIRELWAARMQLERICGEVRSEGQTVEEAMESTKELLRDRDFVLEAVSYDAETFRVAADELRKDPEVFIEALETAERNGIDLKGRFNPVIPSNWTPEFDELFYQDSMRFLDFLARFQAVVSGHESYYGQGMVFTSRHFGSRMSCLFEDWSVVRILFSKELSKYAPLNEYWQCDWGEYLPESVVTDIGDKGYDSVLYEITNREFILFAIKEGSPEVLVHASEELKNDPELKRLVSENTKGSESS